MSKYTVTLRNKAGTKTVLAETFQMTASGGVTFLDREHRALAFFYDVLSIEQEQAPS